MSNHFQAFVTVLLLMLLLVWSVCDGEDICYSATGTALGAWPLVHGSWYNWVTKLAPSAWPGSGSGAASFVIPLVPRVTPQQPQQDRDTRERESHQRNWELHSREKWLKWSNESKLRYEIRCYTRSFATGNFKAEFRVYFISLLQHRQNWNCC